MDKAELNTCIVNVIISAHYGWPSKGVETVCVETVHRLDNGVSLALQKKS